MTVKEAFGEGVKILKKAGADSPAFEMSVMLEDLLGLPRQAQVLMPDTVLTDEQLSRLIGAEKKRAGGYPLQYIVGSWEFFGRKFFVGEGVLIPRPETELLCECVMKFFARRRAPEIVDLCSGTGCVAVTLTKEIRDARVTAVELCDDAYAFLERNVNYHGSCVKTLQRDALEPFGMFDCVVSNPPYVSKNEMAALQKEVTFEPETALFGGEDGLDFYRGIAENWAQHINPGGLIAFEIGETQGRAVERILKENGYFAISVWTDYAGLDRIVTAMK